MKKRLLVVAALIVTVITLCTVFSGAATVPDPSDNYVVQTAPNEDGSISMWFEHSFKKVMTSDVTPSGMNTYSVYMAKNEIESAQFVLYSDTTYSGMDAQIDRGPFGLRRRECFRIYPQRRSGSSFRRDKVRIG